MGNLNKVFKNGEVLFAEDLNPIVRQVNSNTDAIATLAQTTAMLAKSGYKFAGIAAIDETPGTPQQSICKLANAVGEYTGYELEVTQADGVCLFLYDKGAETPAWVKLVLGLPFPGMIVQNVETGTIEAQSNHYYNVTEDVEALELTLPTPTEGRTDSVKVHFWTGMEPTMSINAGNDRVLYNGLPLKHHREYVLTFTFNGIMWNITAECLMPSNCLAIQSDAEFSLDFSESEITGRVEYSVDGISWGVVGEEPILGQSNGRKYILYLRGVGNISTPQLNITSVGLVDCTGDARVMLNYSTPEAPLSEYGLSDMFKNCDTLRSAPELLAATLAEGCYANMFLGCTNLVKAPTLPATTLATECYINMFARCTSLVKAPTLPAEKLAESCYANMFRFCTSLADITMTATNISATNALSYWVSGVAANGTFHKARAMETLPTGDSGIPTGWQVVNV